MPLLDIRNLTIEFKTGDEWVKAVDRVSMTLTEGEIRGLVGESGSGKSLIAKAICGVNKDNWRVTADRMRFDDIDLLRLSARERRKLVGHNVSMIFQEPQSCLDPSERIGLLSKAAKNIATLARASVNQKKFRLEIQARAEAAAANVEKIAKKGGLSSESVEQLRREILGIAG